MFADRFRARVDVYAVRWENARTGAAGWMPAVAGGWRKGMDRRGATYLPRTAEVVAAHLVGDVFMGLYPLMPGNTCHFVVADFDGPTAMLDALAYVKAARASAVPAALEISQSGRGAHVWIFFAGVFPRPPRGPSAPSFSTRRWCYADRWTCGRTTGCSPTRTSCPRAASATSSPRRCRADAARTD